MGFVKGDSSGHSGDFARSYALGELGAGRGARPDRTAHHQRGVVRISVERSGQATKR